MTKKQATTFVLYNSDKKVLMQLRDDGKGKKIEYPNTWCFPGGAPENKEKPVEAVMRETWEEYEIELQKNQCVLLAKYKHNGYLDYVFACRADNSKPKLREGADMRWMSIAEIKKIKLGFGQEKIIPKLEKFLRGGEKWNSPKS